MFDMIEESQVNMASIQGLQVLSYTDLISEGKRLIDSSVKQTLKREEPR